MRRHKTGREHLSDIFYTTGDMNLSSVDNSFGFSRQFNEATSDRMLREERLERQHKKEQEQDQDSQYPSCRLSDRPPGWVRTNS